MSGVNRAGWWAVKVGAVMVGAGVLAGVLGQIPSGVALSAAGLGWVVAGLLGVHQ